MDKPQPAANKSFIWNEYGQKAANGVLWGLSFFFTVPGSDKKHEVQLLEGLSWSEPNIVGEMDVRRICDVMEKAMAPLRSMFVKGAVVTAGLFFAGRALSILPFIPAICYLFGAATLLVTRDLYLATQQMKYALTHFSDMAKDGTDRIPAQQAALRIDENARQSICDMLLFGRDETAPRFFNYASHQLQQSEETVDPSVVTQIFFPALASLAKVRAMASQFVVERNEQKTK